MVRRAGRAVLAVLGLIGFLTGAMAHADNVSEQSPAFLSMNLADGYSGPAVPDGPVSSEPSFVPAATPEEVSLRAADVDLNRTGATATVPSQSQRVPELPPLGLLGTGVLGMGMVRWPRQFARRARKR